MIRYSHTLFERIFPCVLNIQKIDDTILEIQIPIFTKNLSRISIIKESLRKMNISYSEDIRRLPLMNRLLVTGLSLSNCQSASQIICQSLGLDKKTCRIRYVIAGNFIRNPMP